MLFGFQILTMSFGFQILTMSPVAAVASGMSMDDLRLGRGSFDDFDATQAKLRVAASIVDGPLSAEYVPTLDAMVSPLQTAHGRRPEPEANGRVNKLNHRNPQNNRSHYIEQWQKSFQLHLFGLTMRM